MQDAKIFEQVLGLTKPWEVKRVDLGLKSKGVTVEIGVEAATQCNSPRKHPALAGAYPSEGAPSAITG